MVMIGMIMTIGDAGDGLITMLEWIFEVVMVSLCSWKKEEDNSGHNCINNDGGRAR